MRPLLFSWSVPSSDKQVQGESAGSASPKRVCRLPCTLADYGGVSSSALHLTAASQQEFSWSWCFIMEFLFQL